MSSFLLAIDQGTTSTRAMIFDAQGKPFAKHQIELKQYFPQPGWVEHDPEEIWESVLICCKKAVETAGISWKDVCAIGITNQRETTLLWDKKTGKPIHKAIVWQDRRTSQFCETLQTAGHENMIQEKTGLLLDPYFCASKIHWLLENVPNARAKATQGELMFGTIDTFLLWRLTGGQQHATDVTNASRTLLFNIHTLVWDAELLKLFDIPSLLLPNVFDNDHHFGQTDSKVFGCEIPITAIAGDQQAALIGQTCFESGMIKSTYGTGTFLMLNTGNTPVASKNRLLTTIGYRLNQHTTYALEGSIFSAGVIVQWLRDKLGLFKDAKETETLAASLKNNGGVYFVPAFTGLGAPYWMPMARASIEGITRDTEIAHIVRAGLEAIAYQTRDLLDAMIADSKTVLTGIRVDGGMSVNHWLMQFLTDIINIPLERSQVNETTALGVAYLAGLNIGLFESLDHVRKLWACDRRFAPKMDETEREQLYGEWQTAVKRIL